jgi:sterol O-acyltransferase
MEKIDIPEVSSEKCQSKKVFEPRDSLLIQWKESKDFRAVYHTVLIIFVHFYVGKFVFGVDEETAGFPEVFPRSFEEFAKAICVWTTIQIFMLLIYLGFQLWIMCGKYLDNPWYNGVWLIIYISFVIEYFVVTSYLLYQLNLMFSINIVISAMLVISVMKTHSFMRTNVPEILAAKAMDKAWTTPTFRAYLYFMCVPTFLYRDEYPKNQKIRWKIVAISLMEIVMAIIISYHVISWTSQFYRDFGVQEIPLGSLLRTVNLTYIAGICLIFATFIGFLHSFMNFIAEILRFADRNFYGPWWDGNCGESFIKRSNYIVQAFTYNFVYRDLKKYCFNRQLSKLLTFVISGIFHDFILAISIRFCLPLFTISMTIHGIFLTYWNRRFFWENNFIFLMGLFGLNSFYVVFFQMEYFARENSNYDGGFFVPCFWRNISISLD